MEYSRSMNAHHFEHAHGIQHAAFEQGSEFVILCLRASGNCLSMNSRTLAAKSEVTEDCSRFKNAIKTLPTSDV